MQSGVEIRRTLMRKTALCTSILALSVFGYTVTGSSAAAIEGSDVADSVATESPIKHVIILIGENRGLDHTFGVYQPKGQGQTISNILSKGIVNEDGSPGPNYNLAAQYAVSPQAVYYIGAPNSAKTPYNTTANLMPQPNTNGAPQAPYTTIVNSTGTNYNTGPFTTNSSGTGYSAAKCVPADNRSHWSADRRARHSRSWRRFAAAGPVRAARAQHQR